MTQEDKELLFKDLCGRLPYGVKAILSEYHIDEFPYNGTYCDKVINLGICEDTINLLNHIEKYGVKPYLRPMSSMTEEEREELSNYENPVQRTDFYYSHHIDCRFLIEKGLAIEAPKDMYKEK